jgi:FK506-binding nuclear protein
MSGGFFGLIVEAGKTYEQLNELPLRISMASIGPNEKGEVGTKRTYLKFRSEDKDYVVCSLTPEKNETQMLDLVFEPGDELSFLTTGDCAVHLVGNYMLNDYPSMGDSDDEEDDDSEEDESMLDDEIDSDEAGVMDSKLLGIQKVGASKKVASKAAASKSSEAGETSEEEGDSDDSEASEAGAWMDMDDNEEELSEIDLMRHAAGIKRKANGKPLPIPPAGKKAKIVELVDAEENIKAPNVTPDSLKVAPSVSLNTPEVRGNGADQKKNKKAEKQRKQKERREKKNAAKALDETKSTGVSNVESAPLAVGGKGKKHLSEGNSATNLQSAKAVAKQMEKEPKSNGVTPTAKPNGESSSPSKPENTSTPNGDENSNAKGLKKKTFPNGLQFEDVILGKGPRAKPGRNVTVRYIGKLASNGKVFDANTDGTPFDFKLGQGSVIKGWDFGINGMYVGGTRKIIIPPSMGYGAKGSSPKIPPNATLEFEIKLLHVKPQ